MRKYDPFASLEPATCLRQNIAIGYSWCLPLSDKSVFLDGFSMAICMHPVVGTSRQLHFARLYATKSAGVCELLQFGLTLKVMSFSFTCKIIRSVLNLNSWKSVVHRAAEL